jgi:hypothetical protein
MNLSALSMVVHDCALGTWEADAEGPWAQGQPSLHSETVFTKK